MAGKLTSTITDNLRFFSISWKIFGVAICAAIGLTFGAHRAAAEKTFVYCSEGSPKAFNPMLATDGVSFNAGSKTVFNRLVSFKYGTTEIEPSLAESWKVSADGLTFTFKLRKGVKFHSSKEFQPTRDFNADDVVFTFNRQRLKDHPYHNVGGGTYEYFESMDMGKIIKDIKKIDDQTVSFVLTQKEAPFLANLAMDFASILSEEFGQKMLAAKTPDKLDQYPVGTGPFIFTSYQKDNVIRYQANESYFAGRPKIDKLIFTITPDPSVRAQKLKTGECHLIAEPSPVDFDQFKKNTKITVAEQDGLNVGYLAFNTEKKPFDNPIVRKAINMALNRKAYLQAIYMGMASQAKNPIPPTIWSYNNNVKDYEYNPQEAKNLLKKAGLEKGFDTEMWVLPVSRPYNPSGKKMGEMMQADLAQVGIKVKLVTYDWPTYLEKSRKGEHQMIQMGWTGDNGDPDNFLNVLLGCPSVQSGGNLARWCNKSFNDLIQKARQVTDVKTRTGLYQKAQSIFKDEAPWVTLAHARVFRALSASVTGYKIDPLGSERFETLDIK